MAGIETLLATVTVAKLAESVAGARTDQAICTALGQAWQGFRRYRRADSDRLSKALADAYLSSCAELAEGLRLPGVVKAIRAADWVPEGLVGEIDQLYLEPDPEHPVEERIGENVLRELETDLRAWAPDAEEREQMLTAARQGWDGAGSLREAIGVRFRAAIDKDDSTAGALWQRDTLAGAARALEGLHDDHVAIREELKRISEQLVALTAKLEELREREGERERPFVRIREAPPPGFIDRPGLMDWLDERLSEGSGPSLLSGGPGAGKSTLALAFAWRTAVTDRTVVVQYCGPGRGVDTVGEELAKRLPGCDPQAVPATQIEWARNLLRERSALLVLDDVWDPALRGLAPGPPARVIYTCRPDGLWPIGSDQARTVGGLEEREVDLMLESRLPGWFGTHREALRELAKDVEELPYALDIAAGLLGHSLRPKGQAIEHVRGLLGEKLTLYREAAGAHAEKTQRLLAAVALCAQQGVWLPFAAELAELDEAEMWDAAEALAEAALLRTVDREGQVFNVHAVMREALAEQARELEDARVEALERKFAEWDADRTRWGECERLLAEAEEAVESLAASGTLGRFARLADQTFEFAYRTGALGAAMRVLDRQEAVFQSKGDRAGLQRSYGTRALILQAWGRLEEAMELHKREEGICEELNDRAGLQRSYGNQALILQDWGRLEEAMELLKRQEGICEELNHRAGLQRSYGNQALILKAWGRLEEAMELHKREEGICEELNDRAGLGTCYGNQALILKAWGRLEEAMELHKREEGICEELNDRAGLGTCYGNQALILKAWGRLEEAMELHKREEGICEELNDRAGLGTCYGNQALILKAWGRLEEAMELHKREEGICEELNDRAGLQRSYGNQALILQDWGRLEEAMELLKRQEGICEELNDRAGLQASYGNQALILQDWGRLEEAMELLKRQEGICEELNHRAGLQRSYGNQALILKDWGRLEEAMELLKRQEGICEELNDRAGLQRSYGNQALILQDWGRLEEAMELLKRQEGICEELNHRAGLQRSYGNQALILKAWGRLEEAMELHKREEGICEELNDRAGLQRSYGNQALILQDWGRLEEAMELHKREEGICEELNDRAGLGRCYGNQGNLLLEMGRRDEARAAMGRAVELFSQLGMPGEQDQAKRLLDAMEEGEAAGA